MQITKIDHSRYAHKPDPIVFRKENKNIKPVSIVEKPKNKGLDLKG